jgi:E3 ubiquitin-protein ligase DOA10
MTQLLAMSHKQKERLAMIRDALQEKSPSLYNELKRTGKLSEFLRQRERDLMQNYEEENNKLLDKQAREGKGFEGVKEYNMAEYLLWKDVLETWLEFPETTESPMAS